MALWPSKLWMWVDKHHVFWWFLHIHILSIFNIYICMIYIYHTFKNPRISSVTTEKKSKNQRWNVLTGNQPTINQPSPNHHRFQEEILRHFTPYPSWKPCRVERCALSWDVPWRWGEAKNHRFWHRKQAAAGARIGSSLLTSPSICRTRFDCDIPIVQQLGL